MSSPTARSFRRRDSDNRVVATDRIGLCEHVEMRPAMSLGRPVRVCVDCEIGDVGQVVTDGRA